MTNQERRELLDKQLKLLSERSKNCEYQHGGDELARLTSAMIELYKALTPTEN